MIIHNLLYVGRVGHPSFSVDKIRESHDNLQEGTTAKKNNETRVNNLLLLTLTVEFNKYYTEQIVKA